MLRHRQAVDAVQLLAGGEGARGEPLLAPRTQEHLAERGDVDARRAVRVEAGVDLGAEESTGGVGAIAPAFERRARVRPVAALSAASLAERGGERW
ncbi:hypothetical protein Q0F99_10900 [Rathayibacter oskolensis]|uniref:hypothetical protein n=1 Tax=Rathayibacter oskolensis TaxID=1891671 RepID=UPI00265FA6E3|nr:hypothetical protein [Rathayibacter oskolensis]WKK73416.1 hypothetical protein Q0F99_10900 [Rathayibacter oskolensis]